MFDLWGLKGKLVAAAGGVVAILLLLSRVFTLGKKVQQADSAKEAEKQEDELDSSINAGHAAGNRARIDGVQPHDPNDRANRRKRES